MTARDNIPVCNIALRLREMAKRVPSKKAVVFHSAHFTFEELDRDSDAYARGFESIGIRRGIKTLLMVRPGLEFISLTFALFKVGAVPVLIDPGMGRDRLLHCIAGVEPEALIGIPKAHAARMLYPEAFRSVRYPVTVGRRLFWGGHTLRQLKKESDEPFAVAPTHANELAAILFTTGSTGPAKGVEYEHGMFDAQCELIRETYGMTEDDVDLATFPLFALFSVGLGMTAVIPDMDPTRPADADPRKITDAIIEHDCTFSFGSPALWGSVTSWCVENSVKLPSLRNVLMAGAPVPVAVHERFRKILSEEAGTNTPYGATESLPVTNITGREILAETASATTQGNGVCVGKPVHGITVEIIRITGEDIEEWNDDLIVPVGEIGEITAAGPTVTKRYYRNEAATRAHKIRDEKGIRHRMGDVGYKDERGRIWFCGRKNHRVETDSGILYTLCCEVFFNAHPSVRRCALVGIGERPHQRPVIIIELNDDMAVRNQLTRELLSLAAENSITETIKDVLYHPSLPVDVRHNAKINREHLSLWAADRIDST